MKFKINISKKIKPEAKRGKGKGKIRAKDVRPQSSSSDNIDNLGEPVFKKSDVDKKEKEKSIQDSKAKFLKPDKKLS